MKKLLLSLCLFGGFTSAFATPFVSENYVSKNINSPKVQLVDVGSKLDFFEEGHLKGAVQTDFQDWREDYGTYQLMKTPSKLQKQIQSLGLKNNTQIIIYDHKKDKGRLKASYVALALIVAGHKNVSILNGGYDEWSFDEDLVTTNTPKIKKSNYKLHYNKNILVDKNYVLKHIKKIPMLESRPARYYFGATKSNGVKRAGHIPGAMSYFWGYNFNKNKTIKKTDQIKSMLTDGFKLNPKNETMIYCTGGLEASMNWYVLSQVLNYKNLKIYDGSMREWGNLDDTPMVAYKWEMFTQN